MLNITRKKFVADDTDLSIQTQFEKGGDIFFASTIGSRRTQEDAHVCFKSPLKDSSQASDFLSKAYSEIGEEALKNDKFRMQGSCAITAILTKDGKLTVANLGDSQVVLYLKNTSTSEVTSVQLNTLHNPLNLIERARILASGGEILHDRIMNRAINRTLALSRAFGDAAFTSSNGVNYLVSYSPEIVVKDLLPYLDSHEIYIEISCDGMREGNFKDTDISEYIAQERYKINFAKKFVIDAYVKGSSDNITCFFIKVPSNLQSMESAYMFGVYDGHGGKDLSYHVAKEIESMNRSLCNKALDVRTLLDAVCISRHENLIRNIQCKAALISIISISTAIMYMNFIYEFDKSRSIEF